MYLYLLLSVFCLLPFLLGFIFYTPQESKINQGHFITPWWFKSKEPMFSGYRMVAEVAQAVQNNPEVRFICMPESTFNWNIHEYFHFVEMMCEDAPNVAIAFGGHHREDAGLKSSFFIMKNGIKVFCYDKSHLIPLMERSSKTLTRLGLKQLLSQAEFFVYGDTLQDDVAEIDGVQYQVYICSEFFFEAKKPKGIPVLFICNDAWLCCDYAKEWVDLFVTYFSVRYNVPVVFGTVCGKTNI